jgi:hypothetical protein
MGQVEEVGNMAYVKAILRYLFRIQESNLKHPTHPVSQSSIEA